MMIKLFNIFRTSKKTKNTETKDTLVLNIPASPKEEDKSNEELLVNLLYNRDMTEYNYVEEGHSNLTADEA